jgi:Zinc carboxypeptidase
VIGESGTGRTMYGVVINELETRDQREAYRNWRSIRSIALEDPERAQRLLRRFGDDVKIPIMVQGGIHGNEYEGVDAAMDTIQRYATTPYGEDPAVDRVLDHAILIFNPIQNPDGRVAGHRENVNGFDLNRDYLTQSQSETVASANLMHEWLPPELLDLHGYTTPTLIEATTKPHNPSIEYDLWLKWNQPRIDANEAALNAVGQQVQRPINDWCPEAELPEPDGLCEDDGDGVREVPGPDVAEGWDDWGPFYTAMFAQHIGLDSSTVEMCQSTTQCGGRVGARQTQNVVQESTFQYVVQNREGMLNDELEIYRRGDEDAPRPECCPEPFDPEFHNWMQDYPQAYVIPVGDGQRSDAEANRLVQWMLDNNIEVTELERDYRFGDQEFEEDSYVVWLDQPRRGLLDTALSIGVDISPRIQRLYAAPAAWSHGYLWGADIVTVPDEARFKPKTDDVRRVNRLKGGLESGHKRGDGWTLRMNSATAVKALNALISDGVEASLATEAFSGGPAGTAVFGDDRTTERALDDVGEELGLTFRRLRSGALPELEEIERVPRIAVFTAFPNAPSVPLQPGPRLDQSVWVLRELGFQADPITVGLLNTSATDPLAGYDLVFNAFSAYPPQSNATARARLTAFFAGGGGYIGAPRNIGDVGLSTAPLTFLSDAGQATGLTVASRAGNNRSGIVNWENTGGEDSVVTGAYPERDTAIMDPPTWFTAMPASMSVDAEFPTSNLFAAGLWPIAGDAQSATAPGSPIVAHGSNTAGTARLVTFAMNPLYRADPEREWPMFGSAAYWADGE